MARASLPVSRFRQEALTHQLFVDEEDGPGDDVEGEEDGHLDGTGLPQPSAGDGVALGAEQQQQQESEVAGRLQNTTCESHRTDNLPTSCDRR